MRIKASETSGIVVLLAGVGLLLITFTIACIHLFGEINVLPVPSLLTSFGDALSPLIETAIRILYLGTMGWVASNVTNRGLNALLQARLIDKNHLNC